MPTPLATIEAVGLILDLAGIGLSIYDLTGGDPTQEKLDNLERKIDELDAKVDALGANLLEAIERRAIQETLDSVQVFVSASRAARGELSRYLSVENPSEQQRLDAITSAEQAFLGVLGYTRTIMAAPDAKLVVAYLGAVAYTAGIRLQVAHALEDGAMGAEVLRESLAETADFLRHIAGAMPGHLYRAVETETTYTVRIEGGKFVVRFVTTAESALGNTLTNMVEKGFRLDRLGELDSGIIREMAFRQLTVEPSMADRLMRQEYEELGFAGLFDAADQLDALADGEQRDGTSGRDTILGTDGNDLLIGLAGNDRLYGGEDGDVLYGGSGNDLLAGGDGIDVLDGGDGKDTLRGGQGDDTLRGGNGNDTLEGFAGDDTMSGGRGQDRLFAAAGNDTLDGGDGTDTLKGGAGEDTFVFSGQLGVRGDKVVDFLPGQDSIALDGSVFDGLPSGVLPVRRLQYEDEAVGTRATLLYYNGVLSYDADGSGSGAAVEVARFVGAPDIVSADIFVF